MSTKKYIAIGEHQIPLPPMPKNKEDIYLINEKKENAYWRRMEYPKIWYDYIPYDIPGGARKTKINQPATFYNDQDELVSLSEEDTKIIQNLLRRETKMRKNGLWMKNYDEIIWIPPGYRFTLQWVQMKDYRDPENGLPYGQFRHIQNQAMTAWEYVKFHQSHIGLNIWKCKKSGITQIIAGDYLNESGINEGWEMLMASKEYDHAVLVPMTYFFHGYDNLPWILKSEYTKRNEHEIILGKPKNRAKGDNKYLNTHISAMKTKPTMFDGPVVRRGWITEWPKMWEASKVSPDAVYKKTLETVRLQQRKNGALIYESYLPEIDDKGFLEARAHYERSKLSTLSEATGTTESMFINFCIPATKSNELCFDRHGRCDEDKARMLITAERGTKKTSSDKQAHKRTNPLDEDDMFDSGGKGSAFDNIRIALQIRELEKEFRAQRPYKEGHMRWENSLWEDGLRPKNAFGNVWFEEFTTERLMDGEEGSVIFFHDIPPEWTNQVIKLNNRGEDGFLSPLEKSRMICSFDPTDFKLAKDVAEGSKNAGYGGLLDDPILDTQFGKKITDVPLFEYLWRWNDPDKTMEDVYKLMIFLGGRWLIEANKGWVVTQAKLDGMHNFLLLLQKDGTIKPYQPGDENGLVNTTRDLIETYCRAISRYIAVKSMGDIDKLKLLKAIRLLRQMADFNVLEPKKFDAVVAFGYWRIAVESFINYLLSNPDVNDNGVMAVAAGELLNF